MKINSLPIEMPKLSKEDLIKYWMHCFYNESFDFFFNWLMDGNRELSELHFIDLERIEDVIGNKFLIPIWTLSFQWHDHDVLYPIHYPDGEYGIWWNLSYSPNQGYGGREDNISGKAYGQRHHWNYLKGTGDGIGAYGSSDYFKCNSHKEVLSLLIKTKYEDEKHETI